MKSTLVMIVVGVMSVVCAFIFVTRFHSSKGVYDITKPADAPISERPGDDTENSSVDDNNSDTEKDGKAEKVKDKKK
ncbi:MAG: hypothetical protein H8D23_20810, partial [Candidatus Brocadiales bacterium]|nr:hypothetical protein [Candidatus Brocadiales bacterium]